MRKAVAASGVILVLIGAAALSLGIWYAVTNGDSPDLSPLDLLSPGFGTDLLSLLSLSASIIVLGLIFLAWAYRLRSEKTR